MGRSSCCCCCCWCCCAGGGAGHHLWGGKETMPSPTCGRHPLLLHKFSHILPQTARFSATMPGFKTLCAAVLLLLAVGSHTGKGAIGAGRPSQPQALPGTFSITLACACMAGHGQAAHRAARAQRNEVLRQPQPRRSNTYHTIRTGLPAPSRLQPPPRRLPRPWPTWWRSPRAQGFRAPCW